MDQRNVTLANNLVNYSTELKKGEKVLIEVKGTDALPLAKEIVKEAYKVSAIPFVLMNDQTIQRELLLNASEEQLSLQAKVDGALMAEMDSYIGITSPSNLSELSDVPAEKMTDFAKFYSKPVHSDLRLNETKWVVLRYPNNSMAQSANTSLENFQEFYYNVCNLDYSKMSKAMDNLVDLMDKTDKVRITGKGTDLTFSIKDIKAIKCDGKLNIPDGEVYTAPVRDSVNGKLTYNTTSLYQGFIYKDICFEFKDGKIINAAANDTERINKVLDMDEGARYIGEFAIGVNPYILNPMNDTLFDEKIMGSIHFTPGRAYENAFNGNESAIHWDIVYIQTPEYGGGEIYFDDVLIRKDGMFVIDELKPLNPENLK